ncbi:glycosyltransferase WbuB [Idiomarina tyrosinivorans]|uniref:Glycosyltransferase WbuB n=1 Tax=Idiomarina tyrosinivorans TaxID=1445662 RepID=A0A432ZQS9_9GAMM|nr:glycosyltransferase family 4 protein [Idiomarina tyrosinivorans]RUO80259.1 glycosyltransferase WbuB [Idiomarina tyrosinivorans]
MKKRIWIINQYASTPDVGFGGRHYYLAQELNELGHSVSVIASGCHHLLRTPVKFKGNTKKELVGRVEYVWMKTVKYVKAHSLLRVFGWFQFSQKISKADKLLGDKPDYIIYSSPSLIGYIGARELAKRTGAKLVFEVRDLWPLTLVSLGKASKNHPLVLLLSHLERSAYQHSDLVVSNLKYAVDYMIDKGLDPKKFKWIPNGFSKYEVESQKESLSESVVEELPNDKFIVGYTGTLGFANNLGELIKVAKLFEKDAELHFVLVGGGQEEESLKRLTDSLKLDNVTFIKPIPKRQIQSILEKFDLLYIGLPKDDLFKFGVSPNKLFDYLYAGKPILYAVDSGRYNPIHESKAGISIEPSNQMALYNAILKLKSMSPAERMEMGQNGRNLAETDYEYSQLARMYSDLMR